MDDKNLDSLFRDKLPNYEVLPSPGAWSKLEEKLEGQKKKPLWLPLARYAAGFLLVLGIAGLISYVINRDTLTETKLASETPIIEAQQNALTLPAPLDTVTREVEIPVEQPVSKPKKALPQRPSPSIDVKKQMASLPREVMVDPMPVATRPDTLWNESLALESITDHDVFAEAIAETTEAENEIAYKVTIVSRGYAIAPEKAELVEGIEGKLQKIGGFLSKVDREFGELQDAKNELFTVVMASKKEK
nr:hypothetical protein [Cytophagales bacterium]